MKTIYKILLILTIFTVGFSSKAAVITWDGTAGVDPTLWSDPLNWAGGVAPTNADIATFTNANPCTLDIAVDVAGINLSTYSSIITVNTLCTITVGASNFTITAGTFDASFADQANTINGNILVNGGTYTGGAESITVTGTFTVSSGTFTCPSGILDIQGNFTLGGTLDATTNAGIIQFSKTLTINTAFTANILSFAAYTTAATFTINGVTITCGSLGYLSLEGDAAVTINSGNITANASIFLNNTATGGGGTATILWDPSINNKFIQGNATIGTSALPNININTTLASRTTKITNTVSVAGNWTYTQGGTFTVTGSTLALVKTGTLNQAYTTTKAYNNITFYAASGTETFTISSGNATCFQVNGTLKVDGGGSVVFDGSGTINLKGGATGATLSVTNTGASGGVGVSSPTFTFIVPTTTTANHTFSSTSSLAAGKLPNITINRSGTGAVNLSGNISVDGNWTYTAGTVAAGTSTVGFYTSTITGGTMSFNNVETTGSCVLGGNFDVNGTMTINSGALDLSSFNANFAGSFTNNGSTTASTSTTTFDGTTTISGSGTHNFYNLTNSNIGGLTGPASGTINVSGDFANNAAFTPNSCTVVFSGTKIISGSTSPVFTNISNTSGTRSTAISLTIQGNFTNAGTFSQTAGTTTFDATLSTISGAGTHTFYNLTLNAGKALTISNATTVTSALLLKSPVSNGASASLIDDATLTVSGTTTVERYVAVNTWWYTSPPVASAHSTVYDVASVDNGLFTFDETGTTSVLAWPRITTDVVLTPLTGYSYKRKPASGSATLLFTGGALNTGSYTTGAVLTYTSGSISAGWHLVGNPYPSSIDWEAASGWTKTNIGATYYLRSGGAYPTYNSTSHTGTLSATQYIPPMQGFYVKAYTAPGTLGMTNAVRVHYTGQNFWRQKSIDQDLLRLIVMNDTLIDDAVIGFMPGSTDGYDDYDTPKIWASDANIPQLYTKEDGYNVVVDFRPILNSKLSIPLGFKAGVTKTYTIKATELDKLSSGITAILEDKTLNTFHNLRTGGTYSFSSGVVNDLNRFVVHFYDLAITSQNPSSICYGDSAQLSCNNFPEFTYQWKLDGILIPGATSASYTAKQNGVYTVEVINQTNGFQCTSSSFLVTVTPKPIALFAAPNSICAGVTATIDFTGTASSNAVYLWNIDGGTFQSDSTLPTIQANWINGGVKNISLTVSENGCSSNIITIPATVLDAPSIIQSIAGATSLCINSTNNIYSVPIDQNAIAYNWTLTPSNAGVLNTNNNQVDFILNHNYTGNAVISLARNYSCGVESELHEIAISVNPIPGSEFAYTAFTCPGSPINLNYSGITTANTSFIWDLSGGSIISGIGTGNISVSWGTPGSKFISLQVSENNCYSSNTIHRIQVISSPNAPLAPSGSAAVCENSANTIYHINRVNNVQSYEWELIPANSGILNSNDTTATIDWDNSFIGNAELRVKGINNCGSGNQSSPISINVKAIPSSNFNFESIVCADSASTIQYAGNAGPNAILHWNMADGTIISGTNTIQVNWATTGTKNISLYVEENGCSSGITNALINITGIPQTPSIPSGVTELCNEGQTTNYSTNAITNANLYQWHINPPNSGIVTGTSENSSVLWNSNFSGLAAISVNAQGDCGTGASSNYLLIYVNPKPLISVTSDTTLCANQSIVITPGQGFASYLWSNNSNLSSLTIDSAGIGLGSHLFAVTVTDNNGCMASDQAIINFETCTSVEDAISKSLITIYPNPTNGRINIEINNVFETTQIEIFNSISQLVISESAVKSIDGKITKSFDLSNLNKGIYFLKVKNSKLNIVKRIISK